MNTRAWALAALFLSLWGSQTEAQNPDALVWGTFLGGSDQETNTCTAIDSSGNVYVAGTTLSTDFPTTPGVFSRTFSGGTPGNAWGGDTFLAKFSPDGALLFSTYLGGSGDEEIDGITFDASGNLYVVGTTSSADFPTTPAAYDVSFNTDFRRA